MMMMRCLAPSILLLAAAPAVAQAPSHACASEADPAARLACYDKAFPPPPEVIQAAQERVQAEFGLNRPKDPLRNPGQEDRQADPARIQSRVAKVDNARGQRIFRLENDQVWMQTDAHSSGHLQVGELVEVRKGLLGGYTLVMPNGVAVRVRRTR